MAYGAQGHLGATIFLEGKNEFTTNQTKGFPGGLWFRR